MAAGSSGRGPPASASIPSDLACMERATTAQQKPLQWVMLPTMPRWPCRCPPRGPEQGAGRHAQMGQRGPGGVAAGRHLLPPPGDRVGDERLLLGEEPLPAHRLVGDADRDLGLEQSRYAVRIHPLRGYGIDPLAAMDQGVADHEVHERGRHAEPGGDVLLAHARNRPASKA